MALFNSKLPSTSTLLERLTSARNSVEEAEDRWAIAVAGTEQGEDPEIEAKAQRDLAAAHAAVSRLQAIVKAAEAEEAVHAAKERAAANKAHDTKVRAAHRERVKAARTLQDAIKGYVSAYEGLVRSNAHVALAEEGNPRVRRDLKVHTPVAVAREITRAAGVPQPPPGGDKFAAISQDPRKIQPLVSQYEDIASAILPK